MKNNFPTADQILNNAFPYKESPKPLRHSECRSGGFAYERLSKVPPVGVHPRVLFSPEDIPDIRGRLENTWCGKQARCGIEWRKAESLSDPSSAESRIAELLYHGKTSEAQDLLAALPDRPQAHYKPGFIYILVIEALECLIYNTEAHGKYLAKVLSEYAKCIKNRIMYMDKDGFCDNLSRMGSWHSLGSYAIFNFQYLGYAYDFLYNFMNESERVAVRDTISYITKGRIVHGMELPRHWRRWNWMNCSMFIVPLSLAIEGEEGYDARIYEKAVEQFDDYLEYSLSDNGVSSEAVGYTAFGWRWGSEAIVAMARRGDNFFTNSKLQNMKYWQLHSLQPYGNRFVSHGDGGDTGPGVHFIQVMKFFFPNDRIIDRLWHETVFEFGCNQLLKDVDLITLMIFCCDGAMTQYNGGADLGEPLTFFDGQRGILIARDKWSVDAAVFQLEGKRDTYFCSHDHADRGAFTLTAMGRVWAADGFRSIESRHHNVVQIDGIGQGYPPVPCEWRGMTETDEAVFATVDLKYCYDWMWPKPITTKTDDNRFELERFSQFRAQAVKFAKDYDGVFMEADPTKEVVEYYDGYEYQNGAEFKMWDEDGHPIRVSFNPVEYASRTTAFIRSSHTYAIIADNIKKDDAEHLYEWTMMTEWNNDIMSIAGNDIIMGDYRTPWSEFENPSRNIPPRDMKPGQELLLVRILNRNVPKLARDYRKLPSARLEIFEKKDMIDPSGRSFGVNKRIIIPTYASQPKFRILLYPFRYGDDLPETSYDSANDTVVLRFANRTEYVDLKNSIYTTE